MKFRKYRSSKVLPRILHLFYRINWFDHCWRDCARECHLCTNERSLRKVWRNVVIFAIPLTSRPAHYFTVLSWCGVFGVSGFFLLRLFLLIRISPIRYSAIMLGCSLYDASTYCGFPSVVHGIPLPFLYGPGFAEGGSSMYNISDHDTVVLFRSAVCAFWRAWPL